MGTNIDSSETLKDSECEEEPSQFTVELPYKCSDGESQGGVVAGKRRVGSTLDQQMDSSVNSIGSGAQKYTIDDLSYPQRQKYRNPCQKRYPLTSGEPQN